MNHDVAMAWASIRKLAMAYPSDVALHEIYAIDNALENAPRSMAAPTLDEKSIRADERARCAARIYAAAGSSDAECYSATDAADLLSERDR